MFIKDVAEIVLLSTLSDESDSSIRVDAQDGAGNVTGGGGSQGVSEGPDEYLLACC
jgi:hypothetical protein